VIDVSTTYSLELIQNIENAKSKQCLFGLLNESQTPMGARYLRTNILQPSTDASKINARLDAVEELSSKEDMFWATRQGLSNIWLCFKSCTNQKASTEIIHGCREDLD
jgi:DNA mismatch repair protein MSH4